MIIQNRLENSQVQNTKIALMITTSISFLMTYTGAISTSLFYIEGVMYWMLAGDILVSTYYYNSQNYINEIPISEILNNYTV